MRLLVVSVETHGTNVAIPPLHSRLALARVCFFHVPLCALSITSVILPLPSSSSLSFITQVGDRTAAAENTEYTSPPVPPTVVPSDTVNIVGVLLGPPPPCSKLSGVLPFVFFHAFSLFLFVFFFSKESLFTSGRINVV